MLGLGFRDTVNEVVSDLDEAETLAGFGPQHRAADTRVLVLTRGSVGTPTGADGQLAALEVAEELLSLLGALMMNAK